MAKKYVDIEKMISKAANENRPAFNEAAWQKMSALLNKDDRRRPMGWWWKLGIGLLLISAFTFLGYNLYQRQSNPNTENRSSIPNPQTEPGTGIAGSKPPTKVNGNNSGKEMPLESSNSTVGEPYLPNLAITPLNKISSPIITEDLEKPNRPKRNEEVYPANEKIFSPNPARFAARHNLKKNNNDQIENGNTRSSFLQPADEKWVNEDVKINKENSPGLLRNKVHMPLPLTTGLNNPNYLITESIQHGPMQMKPILNRAKSKSSNIYFSALAGLGADGVRYSFDGSRLKSKIGVGIGYGINSKWNVGLGIRVHDKLYTAGPRDYKVSSGYWSTVQIEYIKADCKVYEIPLYASFNYHQKNKTSLFASAGLVSFIMKSEKYDIHYKRNNEPQEGYSNAKGNSHLFSSLLLSAGAAKNLNKKLQISAAPALAIPLSGVGKGKVKLNTAELTVGLQYYPWKK